MLDADDVLLDGALRRDIATLDAHPGVAYTISRVLNYQPDGSTTRFPENPDPGPIPVGSLLPYWQRHDEPQAHPASLCVRAEILAALGGWMAVSSSEDTGLLLTLSAISTGYFIGEPGLHYRVWPGQTTTGRVKDDERTAVLRLIGMRRRAARRHRSPAAAARSRGRGIRGRLHSQRVAHDPRGDVRARAARWSGPAPPTSRVLRIATRRPPAALAPGASAGRAVSAIGQPGLPAVVPRSPSLQPGSLWRVIDALVCHRTMVRRTVGVLEFISSLVGSLAWPAAVILLVVILRQPLGKMLNERPVKTFEAGPTGVRVVFDETLAEARTELVEARTERPDLPTGGQVELPSDDAEAADDFMYEMKQLAEVAPSAVILESFARLERALREALETDFPDGHSRRRFASARELARRAVELEFITPSESAAFADIAVLRSLIAHGRPADLDADRALSYASVVRQLMISISLAQGRTFEGGPIG